MKAISRTITNFFINENIVQPNEFEIYSYGFELLISTGLGIIIVLLIGAICKNIAISVFFYLTFVSIRFFSGGYHAKTHLGCKTILGLCSFFTIETALLIEPVYNFYLHLYMLLIYWSFILEFAPIKNMNKPMDETELKTNKNKCIGMSIVVTIISILMYFINKKYAIAISITLMLVVLMIGVELLKCRKGVIDE